MEIKDLPKLKKYDIIEVVETGKIHSNPPVYNTPYYFIELFEMEDGKSDSLAIRVTTGLINDEPIPSTPLCQDIGIRDFLVGDIDKVILYKKFEG